MDNLMTEGYIRRIERACLEERPRAALAIRLAVREASHAEQDRAVGAMPPHVGYRLLRRSREALGTVGSWLEGRAGRGTELGVLR